MNIRAAALLLLPAAAWCGDWNAAAAAKYLDGRAAEWAAWPRAAKEGGPCVSCHTTLGYLMARPELRHKLAEATPTEFERGLLAGVKVRSVKPAPPATADNTPVVMNAVVLAMEDARRGNHLSPETEAALKVMWATQREDGTWGWTDANLEPWEVPESTYLGAAWAAVAVGIAPDDYRHRPEIQANLTRLHHYVHDNGARQPLANVLLVLWAGTLVGMPAESQQVIIDRAWSRQSDDGGWTLAALGPWRDRPNAPAVAPGSNALATAWAAAMLRMAGVKPEEPHMTRALGWLRAHQDPAGYWDAVSMNKRFAPGSMMERFMRDAATAYASLALSR